LVLLQAHPLAQESEEGIPIDKAKQQGTRASSKVMKQQCVGGGKYLKMASNKARWQGSDNKATNASSKV
jgi:hypothetical protein